MLSIDAFQGFGEAVSPWKSSAAAVVDCTAYKDKYTSNHYKVAVMENSSSAYSKDIMTWGTKVFIVACDNLTEHRAYAQ